MSVGRLVEQKGQLLLIEAVGQLVRDNVALELTLVGDGPLRGDIEGTVQRLGLSQHVRLAGWMSGEQVRDQLEQCRLFILPSFAEGLPVVLMEALAQGRPPVTTAIAGIPELVENGICGWLVPAGAVEALVQTLRAALAADDETVARLGRTGAQRVIAQHDAVTEAGKLAALIRGEGAR